MTLHQLQGILNGKIRICLINHQQTAATGSQFIHIGTRKGKPKRRIGSGQKEEPASVMFGKTGDTELIGQAEGAHRGP